MIDVHTVISRTTFIMKGTFSVKQLQLHGIAVENLLCFFILLFSFLLCTGCSENPEEASRGTIESVNPRLLNGSPVDPALIPQVVSVHAITDIGDTLCTGTVLDPNHILTAAHCVLGTTAATIQANTGNFLVNQILIHPGYIENQEVLAIFNDIAILKTTAHGLPALPIIVSQAPESPAFTTTVYGYGIQSNGTFGSLAGGRVQIALTTENHFIGAAFHGKEASPCNGDSGAPLLFSFDRFGAEVTGLIGLVSTGTTADCSSGDSTFYANLQNQAILNFITSTVPGVSLQ